ncbi:hypothetical protein HGA89_07125, partial [bacterium]|nr:hypothetical protein [bacterium]
MEALPTNNYGKVVKRELRARLRADAEEQGPRRSVVFVATDAEERGPSIGAWHLTMDPPFPLVNTIAAFNI